MKDIESYLLGLYNGYRYAKGTSPKYFYLNHEQFEQFKDELVCLQSWVPGPVKQEPNPALCFKDTYVYDLSKIKLIISETKL